jgi:hypothetical protein
MFDPYIKKRILSQEPRRVYTVIALVYSQELEELKPSLFRKWIAKKMDIPEEKFNLNSLRSAWMRERQREALRKDKSLQAYETSY